MDCDAFPTQWFSYRVFVAYLGSFLSARGEHGVGECALQTQGRRNQARDSIDDRTATERSLQTHYRTRHNAAQPLTFHTPSKPRSKAHGVPAASW